MLDLPYLSVLTRKGQPVVFALVQHISRRCGAAPDVAAFGGFPGLPNLKDEQTQNEHL